MWEPCNEYFILLFGVSGKGNSNLCFNRKAQQGEGVDKILGSDAPDPSCGDVPPLFWILPSLSVFPEAEAAYTRCVNAVSTPGELCFEAKSDCGLFRTKSQNFHGSFSPI